MIGPSCVPPASSFAPFATASSIIALIRAAASLLASEPSTAPTAPGSPAGNDWALTASRAAKSSATASSTTIRSVDMQI